MDLSFATWLNELNSSIPLPVPRPGASRFDRDPIDWTDKSLNIRQAARKVLDRTKNFRSGPPSEIGPNWSPTALQPAEVQGWSGGNADTIGAVINGTKRLGWIEVGSLTPGRQDRRQELVAARLRDIATDRGFTVLPYSNGYFIGKEQDVRELKRLLDRADYLQKSQNPIWAAKIHKEIGRLLGYDEKEVQNFIAQNDYAPDDAVLPKTPHDRVLGYATKSPTREVNSP